MKVKSESEIAQSCLTLSDPMHCSLPGSSVHGIFQARVLEWVAIVFSAQLTLSCAKTGAGCPALLEMEFEEEGLQDPGEWSSSLSTGQVTPEGCEC